ncbi:gamma-glutamyl-gamma-aminobutyrate hydrolase [Raoultella ornithinolytica]|nr:gamma-glutamyl-gamma-aminobutyrate hydrolase [Raoultella ornithinolytica]
MRRLTKYRFSKEDYFSVNTGLQHVLGKLATWAGAKTLSSRLRVEARSSDGLAEAVSVNDHPFALGVQWHPEWNVVNTPCRVCCLKVLSPLSEAHG